MSLYVGTRRNNAGWEMVITGQLMFKNGCCKPQCRCRGTEGVFEGAVVIGRSETRGRVMFLPCLSAWPWPKTTAMSEPNDVCFHRDVVFSWRRCTGKSLHCSHVSLPLSRT